MQNAGSAPYVDTECIASCLASYMGHASHLQLFPFTDGQDRFRKLGAFFKGQISLKESMALWSEVTECCW